MKSNIYGLLTALTILASVAIATFHSNKEHGNRDAFIHTVYFWYNDDVTSDDVASFEASMKNLANVSSISKVFYGPPVKMEPREVVDDSYNYAWITHFRSQKEHDAYQNDPVHLSMIEKHQHMWEKVQVYDNVNLNVH